MNSEEKNINQENDIEVFSLDNMSPDNINENVVDNGVGTDMPEGDLSSNIFMSTPSMVEMPVEGLDSVNSFSYTEIPTVSAENVPVVDSVQDAFSYTENPLSSVTEMPSQTVSPVEPVPNAFVYTETPVALEVPLGDGSAVADSMQNQFSYTDSNNVSNTTVEEEPKEPINNQSSYSEQSTIDSKSNFKFMIVFAIIMLIIIFVLPYIAGYK